MNIWRVFSRHEHSSLLHSSNIFSNFPLNLHVDMSILKRGALVVVEGVDRSGKSTQCRKLVQSLANWNVKAELFSFPDRTTSTGRLIDEYLRDKECKLDDHAVHLLFAANRWESYDKMKKLLYNGVTLIVDRYSFSGIVFSAAKKTLDFRWCQQPENGLHKPDITFLLSLSKEDIAKRPGFGEERYETLAFQQDVMRYYEILCDESENWIKIDASMDIDQVHDEMLTKVLNTIPLVEKTPVGRLDFTY